VKGFRTLCVLAAMLSSAVLHAQGLVLVEQQTREGKTTTNQIQLDKTHIRTESRATGENTAFVYDDAAQTARVMNLDKKTYIEMNSALQKQMQQQLAQLQAQLQNLPPQQRAALEQALRGRGGLPGAGEAPKIQYKRTGSDQVGKWACTKYEGYQGQEKVMELCTVDPKEVGVAEADFEVAKHLAEFLRGFMPAAADQIVIVGAGGDQGFSGIPVRRAIFTNGRQDMVSELKEFRREAIPASVFAVPSDFKREDPMRR
jgi:hypothetical protein